jgi:hypothetical protein
MGTTAADHIIIRNVLRNIELRRTAANGRMSDNDRRLALVLRQMLDSRVPISEQAMGILLEMVGSLDREAGEYH